MNWKLNAKSIIPGVQWKMLHYSQIELHQNQNHNRFFENFITRDLWKNDYIFDFATICI